MTTKRVLEADGIASPSKASSATTEAATTTPVNPKAPVKTKKRATTATTAATAMHSASKPRVTRRELKKLTEMDLEEKDDVPTSGHPKVFGEDTSNTSVTPSSLHDDFVNLMKAQGLEKMATEAGIMKDGSLVDIKKEPGIAESPSDFAGKSLSAATTPTSPSYSTSSSAKKRKYVKINKGLRHFSMKVCQKVEEKHVTTYNEVADELVQEFTTMRPNDSAYDEKNVRRRVYDALNVLMAMDIISKERKEIRWKGLPSSLQHDTEMLLAERNERMKSVEQKKQHLQDLLVQQIAMKNLLKRNAEKRRQNPSASVDEGRILLPFIVVNTNKDTIIQCEMSEDRQDIFFNFSAPFEINDDTEILRRLRLQQCSSREGALRLVPSELASFVPDECHPQSSSS